MDSERRKAAGCPRPGQEEREMENVGTRLHIDPETLSLLSSGNQTLCSAAHYDGSDNRINGEAVVEAATVSFSIAFMTAAFMWLRKKFRNRGKTKNDLAAEKEAARINRTSVALEEMLLEYIRSAQEGMICAESLDELIETLEEVHGYAESGKLVVLNNQALGEIRRSVSAFTAAIAEIRSVHPVRESGSTGSDEFCLIREQLLKQKELIGG